jgi:hypothetical protein
MQKEVETNCVHKNQNLKKGSLPNSFHIEVDANWGGCNVSNGFNEKFQNQSLNLTPFLSPQ